MTNSARRVLTVGACALAGLGLVALLPLLASPGENARELVLVAREMRFYLDGEHDPNPVIRLRAGEAVRLVLRNVDDGMSHDFAIEAWGVATRAVKGPDLAVVEFRVPDRPGESVYRCTPHPTLMFGRILVE